MSSLQYDFLYDHDQPFLDIYLLNMSGRINHTNQISATTTANHGTSVAGTIAMEKDNRICGVGVAYNAFITGRSDLEEC